MYLPLYAAGIVTHEQIIEEDRKMRYQYSSKFVGTKLDAQALFDREDIVATMEEIIIKHKLDRGLKVGGKQLVTMTKKRLDALHSAISKYSSQNWYRSAEK